MWLFKSESGNEYGYSTSIQDSLGNLNMSMVSKTFDLSLFL
jgi:hypothetical protein